MQQNTTVTVTIIITITFLWYIIMVMVTMSVRVSPVTIHKINYVQFLNKETDFYICKELYDRTIKHIFKYIYIVSECVERATTA